MTQQEAIAFLARLAKAMDRQNRHDIAGRVMQAVEALSPPSLPTQDIRQTIGVNLRIIMAQEEITNAELAEWAGIGINTIVDARQGHRYITLDRLVAIAQVLRRPLADFFEE